MGYLKKIPLAACGTALAIASAGNLFEVHSVYLKIICGVISIITLILITLKILIYRRDFKRSMCDINTAGVFPAYFMTFMVLSTYGRVFIGGVNLSKVLWLTAFAFHIFHALAFIKNHIKEFKLKNMLPTWFVTFVAYALVGAAAPSYDMRLLGQAFVIVGLVCYFILFPAILYRVLFIRQIPEKLKPAVWLFNSPVNICIVAYMSSFTQVSPVFLLVLLSFSIFSFIVSFAAADLKHIVKNGFNNSLSSFTFPTVIFVTAIERIYYYFYDRGFFKVNCSDIIIIIKILCVFIVFGIFLGNILYVCKKSAGEEGAADVNLYVKDKEYNI